MRFPSRIALRLPFHVRYRLKRFFTKDVLTDPLCEIGVFTYGIPTVRSWGSKASLTVGKYCSIADDVEILLGGHHRIDWVTSYPFPVLPFAWPEAADIPGYPAAKENGDVVIGNDVWIAHGVTVMSGVTVGDGAVLGARAVVAKDVAPYSIVVGNPAREVGKRFSDEEIDGLLQVKWWDWPEDEIRGAIPLLCSGDIAGLLALRRPTAG